MQQVGRGLRGQDRRARCQDCGGGDQVPRQAGIRSLQDGQRQAHHVRRGDLREHRDQRPEGLRGLGGGVGVSTIAGLIGSSLDSQNQLVFCDGSTPIDPSGDDTGTFNPADSTGFKAMVKAGTCVSKLVATWEKCHATFAKNVLKNKVDPTDPGNTDEICEGDGDSSNPKGAVEAFQACMTKLAAKGLPACVQVGSPNYNAILATTQTQLDGANGLVYCASPSGAFVQ